MTRIKNAKLQQNENQLLIELSEHELEMIVGGLNIQPISPGIARQPEFREAVLVKGAL